MHAVNFSAQKYFCLFCFIWALSLLCGISSPKSKCSLPTMHVPFDLLLGTDTRNLKKKKKRPISISLGYFLSWLNFFSFNIMYFFRGCLIWIMEPVVFPQHNKVDSKLPGIHIHPASVLKAIIFRCHWWRKLTWSYHGLQVGLESMTTIILKREMQRDTGKSEMKMDT